MKRRRTKKLVLAAVIAVGLTGGTAAAAVAYQSGSGFTPFGNNRDIRNNQVVFSDSEDVTGRDNNDKDSQDDLWQKDQNADEQNENNGKAKYLLAADNTIPAGNTGSASLNNGSSIQDNSGSSQQPGTVYDVTDDKSKADVIINNGSKPSDNGTNSGDQNNSGNNGSADNNGSGDNSSDNNNGSHNNGNNGSDDNPDTPDDPSDYIKDPDMSKSNPSIGIDSSKVVNKPYTEKVIPAADTDEDGDNISVIIEKALSERANTLYVGQKIDGKMIFYAMNTFVRGRDGVQYLWGEDAWNKYIRVNSVSFDGGKTWISKFPVKIPSNIPDNQMQIKFGYRFKTKDKWSEKKVTYAVELNRIYVLNDKVKNNQIDADDIINYEQSVAVGTNINLLRYLSDYLGSDNLTELFPGWMENGKLVPWFYIATEGRHILEPADKVPISDEYEVKLMLQWMSDDYEVGFQYDNLCYLQTLTGFNRKAVVSTYGKADADAADMNKVSVPKYVQAVILDDDVDLKTNYMEIPDTVLYIDTSSSTLDVREGYEVSEQNSFYASTEEGLLTNKSGTEILGIPSRIEEVIVPAYVTKINLSANSQFPILRLEAESLDEIPEIAYGNLNNCKIIVKDDLLDDFIIANYEAIETGNNNCVAAESEPDVTYTVMNHAIVNNEGGMRRALPLGNTNLKLTSDIHSLCGGAFNQSESITMITMPENGDTVTFEENCFADSQVKTILCYSMEQYLSAEMQLEQAGGSDDLEVKLLSESREGDYYAADADGENAILIKASQDTENYDGTLTALDGSTVTVTSIGDEAFANCQSLEWVILPESVDTIGYQAFVNCSQLQGVLINAKESITIGNRAWDGCDSLRFIASNAMEGIMLDDYNPEISDRHSSSLSPVHYFFVPTNADGYASNGVQFTEESGVAGYTIESIGECGKMLYGLDSDGEPWLALRAGTEVDDQVQLPAPTQEIYTYAMADTKSPSGTYTLNLDETSNLWAFDGGAFEDSDLGGDIDLDTHIYIGDEAFLGCAGITSFLVKGTCNYLGQESFTQCTSLKTADFGELTGQDAAIYRGIFTGCDALTDLTLHNETAPQLVTSGGTPFAFNWYWSNEEEIQNLQVHIPEGSEESYIIGWRYLFAGYTETPYTSAYLEMWNAIQVNNIDWDTWEYPADEDVDVWLKEELLDAENRVRAMIDAEQVSEPTDFYPYRQSEEGELTLIGAPSYVQDVVLTPETLDMPSAWYLDYIGTDAFSNSPQLRSVTCENNLVGIYTNAFEGLSGSKLTLYFNGTTPAQLLGGTRETPFTFGTTGDGLSIVVPEGSEKVYVQAWVYPIAGYENLDELLQSLDEGLTDQEKQEEAAKLLMPVENQLRKMLGLSEVSEASDLWSLQVKDEEITPDETEESTETDETSIQESESETVPSESETETIESETETESETQDTSMNETETSESETETEEETMTESEQPEEKESEQEGDLLTK